MANGACFKHIAKIYASPARKVAVLPLLLLWKHLIKYTKTSCRVMQRGTMFYLYGILLF